MFNRLLMTAIGFTALWLSCASPPAAQSLPRVLVYSRTAGFRHDSISDGINAIRQLGQQSGFIVDATENPASFNDANLAQYKAVVFLSTTGDVLDGAQQAAFERFMRKGNGYVGIHAASDTEYDWPWYGGLVGAWFQSHPAIQQATIRIEDPGHPSTAELPTSWRRNDEWYNFRINPRGRVKVLATLDETTYNGGGMGADHPICWCQMYDSGRAWYTAGGHTRESFSEPLFRSHLLGGILFAAGLRACACAVLAAANGASFRGPELAGESIVALFGSSMTTSTESATATPLPVSLGGISLRVRDGAGQEHAAPLFFASPTQINFLLPPNPTSGEGALTLLKADGTAPSAPLRLAPIAPALFSANANGQGVAAGVALRIRGATRSFEAIAQLDPQQNRFLPRPIDLSDPNEEVYLLLFGTGFRALPALSGATLTIGGTALPVLFAGAQGTLAGLDQINVLLPRNLAARGEVDLFLTANGSSSNIVRLHVR
ncbi:MAG: ThuA domain-containing protein [Blastocatellia bacterium]|nr:ThuA domain-containing protein [Blastocatellia bacterium]